MPHVRWRSLRVADSGKFTTCPSVPFA